MSYVRNPKLCLELIGGWADGVKPANSSLSRDSHKPLQICCDALDVTARIWCTPYQYDSQSQGKTRLHATIMCYQGFKKTERMQSACLTSLKKVKGCVSKKKKHEQKQNIYRICLHFLKHSYSKYINCFVVVLFFFSFQVKPTKLSLVEKNILKSTTGYKCYLYRNET